MRSYYEDDIDKLNEEIDKEVERRLKLDLENNKDSSETSESSPKKGIIDWIKPNTENEWLIFILLILMSIMLITPMVINGYNSYINKDKYEISGIHEVRVSNVEINDIMFYGTLYKLSLNDLHEDKNYEVRVVINQDNRNKKISNFIKHLSSLGLCIHSNNIIKADFSNYTILK